MKSSIAMAVFGFLLSGFAAGETPSVKLWPGDVPDQSAADRALGEISVMGKRQVLRIQRVNDPSLELFPAPEDKAVGTTVLVCPGGGYNILAYNLEGTEIATWLNSIGVHAAVLKYRVPRRDVKTPHPLPLQDAQRALRLLRHRGAEWGMKSSRLGILGFSAGGHLTVMAATHWRKSEYPDVDEAEKESCRPDFMIPIYPAYLGDQEKKDQLSPLVAIDGETPPAFIAITQDDSDRAIYASLLFIALKQAKVETELHIYSKGGHGYGLRPSENPVSHWPTRCAEWMALSGFLGSSKSGEK